MRNLLSSKVPSYWLFILLVAAVVSFILFRFKHNVDPLPEFLTKDVSLGTMERGQKATAVFRCFNRGLKPLVIQAVNVPDNCVVTSRPQKPIWWRGEGQVVVEYDSASDEHMASARIEIITNSKRRPKETLQLSGNITFEESISPSRIYLCAIHGQSNSTRFLVQDEGTSPLDINKVSTSASWLTASIVPDENNPSKFNGTASLSDDAPIGKISERLLIELKGEKSRTIKVPVGGVVRSAFAVSPPKLVFGLMKTGEARSATVTVSRRDGKLFQVTNSQVSEQPKGMEFSVQPQPDGCVTVTGTYTSSVGGTLRGEVIVTTDAPDEPRITIPLIGYAYLPDKLTDANEVVQAVRTAQESLQSADVSYSSTSGYPPKQTAIDSPPAMDEMPAIGKSGSGYFGGIDSTVAGQGGDALRPGYTTERTVEMQFIGDDYLKVRSRDIDHQSGRVMQELWVIRPEECLHGYMENEDDISTFFRDAPDRGIKQMADRGFKDSLFLLKPLTDEGAQVSIAGYSRIGGYNVVEVVGSMFFQRVGHPPWQRSLRTHWFLCPERGLAPVKMQYVTSRGEVWNEIVYSDLRDLGQGLWFPFRHESRSALYSKFSAIGPNKVFHKFTANMPLSLSTFEFTPPSGTRIRDQMQYVETSPGATQG